MNRDRHLVPNDVCNAMQDDTTNKHTNDKNHDFIDFSLVMFNKKQSRTSDAQQNG
jgi:hypothetical protein